MRSAARSMARCTSGVTVDACSSHSARDSSSALSVRRSKRSVYSRTASSPRARTASMIARTSRSTSAGTSDMRFEQRPLGLGPPGVVETDNPQAFRPYITPRRSTERALTS